MAGNPLQRGAALRIVAPALQRCLRALVVRLCFSKEAQWAATVPETGGMTHIYQPLVLTYCRVTNEDPSSTLACPTDQTQKLLYAAVCNRC